MLSKNAIVKFEYGFGANSLTLTVQRVIFGVEFIGDVEEDIDFSLVEDYQGVRVTIQVQVRLFFGDTVWMAGFLASNSKKLTIDGTIIDVVNDDSDVDFDLFGDSSFAANVELRFKGKSVGIPSFGSAGVGYPITNVGA